MKPILGIDLGTTKCVACVRLGNECVEIPPAAGGPYAGMTILPSVFLDVGDGHVVVGEEVNRKYSDAKYGPQVVRNVKRFMWRNADNGKVPAKIFRYGSRLYSPASISSQFLLELKKAAERETDRLKARPSAKGLDWSNWLDSVVVTVPAYFSSDEREATHQAAELAGFQADGIKLLSEPVAAALAWQAHLQNKRKLVLVVDLGGGTCDLTLLATGEELRELGYFGDNQFGGLEWDLSIAEAAVGKSSLRERLLHFFDEDALPDYSKYGDLFKLAEEAKKDFCRNQQLDEVGVLVSRRPDEFVKISRHDFDAISAGHAEYCGKLADLLIERIAPEDLGWRASRALRWSDIDHVLLVGGGSQIPHVHEVFKQRWGRNIKPIESGQMAVARGAAVYGQLLSQGKKLSGIGKPRCLHDIGIMAQPKTENGVGRRRWLFWPGSRSRSNGQPARPKPPVFSRILARNSPLPHAVPKVFRVPHRGLRELFFEISRIRHTRYKPQGFREDLEVQRIDLSSLPPPQDENEDVVKVSMEFDERQRLRVVIICRGNRDEREFGRGDFD